MLPPRGRGVGFPAASARSRAVAGARGEAAGEENRRQAEGRLGGLHGWRVRLGARVGRGGDAAAQILAPRRPADESARDPPSKRGRSARSDERRTSPLSLERRTFVGQTTYEREEHVGTAKRSNGPGRRRPRTRLRDAGAASFESTVLVPRTGRDEARGRDADGREGPGRGRSGGAGSRRRRDAGCRVDRARSPAGPDGPRGGVAATPRVPRGSCAGTSLPARPAKSEGPGRGDAADRPRRRRGDAARAADRPRGRRERTGSRRRSAT